MSTFILMFYIMGLSNIRWEMKEKEVLLQFRRTLYNCLLCRLTFYMLFQVFEKPLLQQHKKLVCAYRLSAGGYSLHSATTTHIAPRAYSIKMDL